MKRLRPGLRIEILLSLTLLLVAAMVLTSFVIMRVTEQDLLQYKVLDGKSVVERMQAGVEEITKKRDLPPVQLIKERLAQGARWMASSGLFGEIVVVGKDGTLWVGKEDAGRPIGFDDPEISSVLRTGKQTTRISRDRGLLTVTSPLLAAGECIAAVQVPVRIDVVMQGLRRSQLLIWFYIGLNVLVLLVFGNYLLSRIVIRPIKRLVRIADHFEETDLFSTVSGTDRNEVAHLSMSLNRMLKRLAENKERMESQIRSLEQANQQLKQAREEVLRSEKLSSTGRLAAGVAHEVGNPIGAILGYANLLADHVKDGEAKDYIARIEKEITRINTIVRELLDFSRPSDGDSAPIDVNALVSETVSFFSHQKLMASVQLETRLEKDVGTVWADADQLKQVLINLMFNACDSMEEGGRLTISTMRTLRPEATGTGSEEYPTQFIEISVSDTGKGIAESELNKIFDPFYTTKPPGKGTGLGLAISLRIIESFGGSICAESVEGQGSTFAIRLSPWSQKHDGQ
ncbi:MAG: HAMP domain-containing protein [Desulfobacterales bacterium]|nr:HAMP domain-containing protein [Desulfobacterales bacterium]